MKEINIRMEDITTFHLLRDITKCNLLEYITTLILFVGRGYHNLDSALYNHI